MQSRLHLRIHTAQHDLKKQLKGEKLEVAGTAHSEEQRGVVDVCIDALEELQLVSGGDCDNFMDAVDDDGNALFNDDDGKIESILAFKSTITEDDARKIIEGKQLK